jgi:CHAT domain-containing protein
MSVSWAAGAIVPAVLFAQSSSAPIRPLDAATAGVVAKNEVVRYSLAAPAPSFVRLAIDAFQSPIRIVLRDSGDRRVKEASPAPELFGAGEFVAMLEKPGTYVVEISPLSADAVPASYELRVTELVPAGEQDERRIRASEALDRVVERIRSASAQNDELSGTVAEAARVCQAAADPLCVTRATFIKGLAYLQENRFADARGEFESVARAAEAAGDAYREAAAISRMVLSMSKLGKFREGTELARKAVQTVARAHSPYLTADAHSGLCGMLAVTGERVKAIEECQAAVRIAKTSRLRAIAGETEVRLGYLMDSQGQPGAEDMVLSARLAFQSAHNREGEAYALETLAAMRIRHGDFQGALDFAKQTTPLYDNPPNPFGQANNLRTLGSIYARLNQVAVSQSYFEKAAAISHAIHDQSGEAEALLASGIAKARKNDGEGGLADYRTALELYRVIGMRSGEAAALRMIGDLLRLKDPAAAAVSLKEALSIVRELKDLATEGQIIGTLGAIARSKRDYATALEYYRQGFELKRQAGDRFGIAISRMAIAAVLRSQGKLDEARLSLGEAVRDIEAQRAQVVSPNLRMSYFTGVQAFYENYIDLLMEMHSKQPAAGYDREAFQISESARARVLLDNLPELRDLIPPELAAQEKQIREGIEAAKRTAQPATDVDLLQARYDQLYGRTRSEKAWYAASRDPQLLTPQDVATKLLDSGTILLEYKICDSKTYVWVVTATGLYTAELPGRQKLRALVSDLVRAQKLQTIEADDEYWKAAEALARELIAPIAGRLSAERILLVADDVLQRVPFSALPWPAPDGAARRTPMIARFEIVNLPSASAAAAVRSMAKQATPFAKDIAVFADPVFRADDERLRLAPAARNGATEATRVRVRIAAEGAEALARQLPRNKVSVFTGLHASIETLQSAPLQDFRVIYFATHAQIDEDHPETSALELSTVNAKGGKQPGTLRIFDIYQLHLRPDLVVLSDCSTAEGANRAGEGLVTFARAFLFAGARRVIATLWPIEDAPAERLTQSMFSRLLGAHRLPPSTALRQTQLALWRAGDSPRQWAAFIMIGDWE